MAVQVEHQLQRPMDVRINQKHRNVEEPEARVGELLANASVNWTRLYRVLFAQIRQTS